MTPDELYAYLQSVFNVTNGRSVEAVVYLHGRDYPSPSRSSVSGRSGECYLNAFYVATHNGWTYVEGCSATFGVVQQHAWAVDLKGNVIETTWKTPGTAYYGIALDMDFIHRVQLETRVYGALNFRSKTFRQKYGFE